MTLVLILVLYVRILVVSNTNKSTSKLANYDLPKHLESQHVRGVLSSSWLEITGVKSSPKSSSEVMIMICNKIRLFKAAAHIF